MRKKVELKYLHIAPRKVRLVADLIRGKSFEQAQNLLNFTVKRGAGDLLRLLKSALAASGQEKENVYIKKIFVDEGPKYKRWMPRARGQAYEIQKKTSHVTIVLEGKEEGGLKTEKKKPEILKPETAVLSEKPKTAKEEKSRFTAPKTEVQKPRVQKTFKRFFRRKAI